MKILPSLLCAMLIGFQLTAQTNITIEHDSLYVAHPAVELEISLPSSITNHSGDTVTIRWTRVIEQLPAGWTTAFCDKNLCYFGTVPSKTFELAENETGTLKPVFYPAEVVGIGVVRVYYRSETAGVSWADTAVYVGEGKELLGIKDAELVKDIQVYPNPSTSEINIVVAGEQWLGSWRITDLMGREWSSASTMQGIVSTIPVAELPSGLYLIHLNTEDGRRTLTKQFSIQH